MWQRKRPAESNVGLVSLILKDEATIPFGFASLNITLYIHLHRALASKVLKENRVSLVTLVSVVKVNVSR